MAPWTTGVINTTYHFTKVYYFEILNPIHYFQSIICLFYSENGRIPFQDNPFREMSKQNTYSGDVIHIFTLLYDQVIMENFQLNCEQVELKLVVSWWTLALNGL